jgi:hypothetical protein
MSSHKKKMVYFQLTFKIMNGIHRLKAKVKEKITDDCSCLKSRQNIFKVVPFQLLDYFLLNICMSSTES